MFVELKFNSLRCLAWNFVHKSWPFKWNFLQVNHISKWASEDLQINVVQVQVRHFQSLESLVCVECDTQQDCEVRVEQRFEISKVQRLTEFYLFFQVYFSFEKLQRFWHCNKLHQLQDNERQHRRDTGLVKVVARGHKLAVCQMILSLEAMIRVRKKVGLKLVCPNLLAVHSVEVYQSRFFTHNCRQNNVGKHVQVLQLNRVKDVNPAEASVVGKQLFEMPQELNWLLMFDIPILESAARVAWLLCQFDASQVY